MGDRRIDHGARERGLSWLRCTSRAATVIKFLLLALLFALLFPQVAHAGPPGPRVRLVRWIEIDLGAQELAAWANGTPVATFDISTGLPRTPTPPGRYRIYLKLRYDDMAGPGYYLPDVPCTMYFYKGYAIHGTYWHDNFGTPMSHGCVNLRTPDACWLFDWTPDNTRVWVH